MLLSWLRAPLLVLCLALPSTQQVSSDRSSCQRLCEVAREHESEKRMRQFACTEARPFTETEDKEHIAITYCGRNINNPYHRSREAIQRGFLHDLFRHSNFNYTGPLSFNTGDNGSINCETALALRSWSYPFLSHALLNYSHTCPALNSLIFQPDHHFIQSHGFKDLISKLQSREIPLSERIKKVVWRGSPTGRQVNGCDSISRVRLCHLAKNISWLDFGISKHLPGCPGLALSNRIPEEEWTRFRGILDIDGNVNAWGLFWRLASGSTVFKVEGPWTNAYIGRMRPWVHYIPIFENLTNLEEVTRIITSDDVSDIRMLSDIAVNAMNLVMPMTYVSEVERVARELSTFM